MTVTGKFNWYELMTTDTKAAQDFYGKVVGWTAEDVGQGAYFTFNTSEGGVAGLLKAPEDAAGAGPVYTPWQPWPKMHFQLLVKNVTSKTQVRSSSSSSKLTHSRESAGGRATTRTLQGRAPGFALSGGAAGSFRVADGGSRSFAPFGPSAPTASDCN